MAEVVSSKLPIGISACAFGCPVRYNGRSFDALAVMGRERGDFVFTPVCPECAAGLGVPRVPIHLTGTGAQVLAGKAAVVDRRGRDVTEQVLAGCTDAMAAVERAGCVAFIAKEKSPSCGLVRTRTGTHRDDERGEGVFGAMLIARGLFLIPDDALANSLVWWDARRRLHAWVWLRERSTDTASSLYDAWHVLKFIVQETDRPRADTIGRSLAALPHNASTESLMPIRDEILDALRTPSSKARIRAWMWKTYVHAKKKGKLDGVDLHELSPASPEVRTNVDRLARELIVLERISFENDLLFGTSPVIRRDRRRIAARDADQSTAPIPTTVPASTPASAEKGSR